MTQADLLWVVQLPLAILRGCRARMRGGRLATTVDAFVHRIWNGDKTRFHEFVTTIHRTLSGRASVYVSGSAATGRCFLDGRPFDARGVGTSDIDLVLVGPNVRELFPVEAGRHLEQTTFPFSNVQPELAPVLTALRRSLVEQAGREVNIVAMTPFYRRVLEIVNGSRMLRIK